MPVCRSPRTCDPMAERLYILEQRAKAENDCEVIACEVALRVLERRHPWLIPKPVMIDLTDFLF